MRIIEAHQRKLRKMLKRIGTIRHLERVPAPIDKRPSACFSLLAREGRKATNGDSDDHTVHIPFRPRADASFSTRGEHLRLLRLLATVDKA
jgi:hypothetical protein